MMTILFLSLFINRLFWIVNNAIYSTNKEKRKPLSRARPNEIIYFIREILSPVWTGSLPLPSIKISISQAYKKDGKNELRSLSRRIRMTDYLFVLAIVIAIFGEITQIDRELIFGISTVIALLPASLYVWPQR